MTTATDLIEAPRGELAETAAAAAAGLVQAKVQARYALAHHPSNRRDVSHVRSAMLRECKRPRFAAEAEFSLPRWNAKARKTIYITGPTIRFAEAIARAWGNLDTSATTLFDDDQRRIVRVEVTDLESNATYSRDVLLSKVVERHNVGERDASRVVGRRQTSTGDVVYLVAATERDFLQKEGAEVSRVLRTLLLRLIPADLVEECLEAARATAKRSDKADPEAATKQLADAFDALGVRPAMLREVLGVPLDAVSPAQIAELRRVYASIRDGATTWKEYRESVLEADAPSSSSSTKAEPAEESPAEPAPEAAKPSSRGERVRQAAEEAANAGKKRKRTL